MGFKSLFSGDHNFKEIMSKGSLSLGMRILGIVSNFAFLFFVTAYFGSTEWGIFAICFSILQIFSLIGTLGMHIAIVKVLAQGCQNPIELYKNAIFVVIPFSLILISVLCIFSSEISQIFNNDGLHIEKELIIAALGILPYSIALINSGVYRANRHIILFSFFDSFGRFFFGGIVVVIFYFLFDSNTLNILIGFVIGLYILMFCSFIKLKTALSSIKDIKGKVVPIKQLLSIGVPLFWTNFINIGNIWAVTLILGYFLPKESVGLFDAVNRLAGLMTIILFAVNSISGPKFAESISDKINLKSNIDASTKIIFYLSIPLFIVLLITGRIALNILGHESSDYNYHLFVIIIMGQLINNLSGSVGILLQMTGYHILSRNIALIALISNIIFLVLLVPIYGLFGAAIIVGMYIALKNLFSVYVAYNKIGLMTIYNPFKLK